MTEHNKNRIYEWTEATPRQEVSNRSIFRVQQLSDELKDQLNEIPLFKKKNIGPVSKVLFATRDEFHEHRSETSHDVRRWYNFRLCESYYFPEEVRTWLQAGKSRIDRFKCLFDAAKITDAATRCRFETFKTAVNDPNDGQGRRMAVEQLVTALAVLPYRGVLLDALEKAFCLDDEPETRTGCFYFAPAKISSEKGNPQFKFSPFTGFVLNTKQSTPEDMPPIEFCDDIKANKELRETLTTLFADLLLPFTRAYDKFEKPSDDNSSPYSKSNDDLVGFAVPAYDIWDGTQWLGGMAGWLVICLDPKKDVKKFFDEPVDQDIMIQEKMAALCEHSWLDFTHLVRAYVRRVREAHMRDLLEDYAEMSSNIPPHIFFEKHIHEIIGWVKRTKSSSKHRGCHLSEIDIPLGDDGDSLILTVDEMPDTKWSRYKPCSFPECPKRYAESCAKSDTQRRGCGKMFPPGTRRLCKLFLEELKLIEAQRRAGMLISAHDYSKEVGSACLRMMDFNKTLLRGREAIREHTIRLAECPDPAPTVASEIEKVVDGFDAPRIDWFSGVRFTNAHLQTQTTGAIIGEPAECVALLENGTLRDIYEIVRILVWLPFDYVGYKQIEKSLGALKGMQIRNPATWAYLFRYDIAPNVLTNQFHEQLGNRIAALILDEQITEPQFFSRFHPPDINPGTDLDESVLWKASDEDGVARWRPVDRLLPLFVFSLRFAFQCAWGKTILESPRKPEAILISGRRKQARTYEIDIDFPLPVTLERDSFDNIPYFAEWQRQIGHYTDRTYPWHIKTPSCAHDILKSRITLSIAASI